MLLFALFLSLASADEGIYFFHVHSPSSLKYTYEIRLAKDFGRDFVRLHKGVELVPAEPSDACQPLSRAHVRGRIVLAERGECSFVTKAVNVEEAGGLATMVTDSAKGDDGMVEMIKDETERRVAIPAVYLPGNHGKVFQSYFKYGGEAVRIDIPLNLTLVPLDKVRKPPWDLW